RGQSVGLRRASRGISYSAAIGCAAHRYRRQAHPLGGRRRPRAPADRNPDAKIQLSGPPAETQTGCCRRAACSYLGRSVVPLITPPTFFAGPPIAAVAEAGRTMAVPLITPLGVASLEASKPTLPCCLLFVFDELARSGTARPIALVALPGLLAMPLLPAVAAIPTAFFTPSAPFITLLLATPETSCASMPTEFLA